MRLAVLDALAVELGGPQHDKEDTVVDIQFGALVRLIGVLDHQLVKPELGLNLAEQRSVGFVQTQPNDPAVAACKCTDFLDGDIAYSLAVAIERARDDPRPLRHICGFGAGEVEHFSQRP